jgi:hypothetical protein
MYALNHTNLLPKRFSQPVQDDSDYSEVLFPDLLQRLPKGFSLWHGTHDGVLFSEGTKIAIQNLTWAGQQVRAHSS